MGSYMDDYDRYFGKPNTRKGETGMVTFTPERQVIVAGGIYEAAQAFWEAVRTLLPESWVLKVGK